MMLGIEINGEYLDLPPGTTLQLEKNNPFLEFADNQETGSYSLPFEVLASPKNLRLLNYAAILQQRFTNTAIEATIYDNGVQVAAGKIKLEKASININKVSTGRISCYFLTDVSSFFQDIKDLKLRDIDVGGDRTFANSVLDYVDETVFGTHVKTVMSSAPGSYDYAFYPVRNSAWGDDSGVDLAIPPVMPLMNNFIWDPLIPGAVKIQLKSGPIVPFPYLKYVLTKALEYAGWSYDGDILDDVDFEKITMINFRSIHWGYTFPLSSGDPEGPTISANRDPVVFNLKDHLPDMTIAEFLIAIKNRLGLWYDVNSLNKKITIRYLRDIPGTAATDMTAYADPVLPKKFTPEGSIYALKNNFITGGGSGIDISQLDYQGSVDTPADLPSPVVGLINQVYLIQEENNYYICSPTPADSSIYEWVILAANIYDYLPTGFNKEVTTSATTVEMIAYNDYLDLIPRIDSPGIWAGFEPETKWGVHLCFYHGYYDNKAGDPFPFASHHIYDSTGVQRGNWSLAFKGEETDATQVGLYDLNWLPFFEMLDSSEECDIRLYLPRHVYLQLRFSQKILISGVEFFIKRVKTVLPYKGQVTVEAVRV
jgi:hypothetical protein